MYLTCLDQLLEYSDPILIVSTANESNIVNETAEIKSELLNILRNTFGEMIFLSKFKTLSIIIITLHTNLFLLADIKIDDSSMENTLPEVGLDSLMSAEIQQIFQRKFGIELTANDIHEMTIARLTELHAQAQKQ